MAFRYRKEYFNEAAPHIVGNSNLRGPQIDSYFSVSKHFNIEKKKSDALVVIPTGVGKTGLIGILPYGISNGRVLVITPQVMIRETVVEELDPTSDENYWIIRHVFENFAELPAVIEIVDSKYNREVLDVANIVILNIHKLQSRLESSPLNFLPEDYFDMIIIDEAHHSAANTWIKTLHYFSNVKSSKNYWYAYSN